MNLRKSLDLFSLVVARTLSHNCHHCHWIKKNPEDIDTKAEDHLYDAMRYGIMSRPRFSIFDYDPHGRPGGGMPIADSTFGY